MVGITGAFPERIYQPETLWGWDFVLKFLSQDRFTPRGSELCSDTDPLCLHEGVWKSWLELALRVLQGTFPSRRGRLPQWNALAGGRGRSGFEFWPRCDPGPLTL